CAGGRRVSEYRERNNDEPFIEAGQRHDPPRAGRMISFMGTEQRARRHPASAVRGNVVEVAVRTVRFPGQSRIKPAFMTVWLGVKARGSKSVLLPRGHCLSLTEALRSSSPSETFRREALSVQDDCRDRDERDASW